MKTVRKFVKNLLIPEDNIGGAWEMYDKTKTGGVKSKFDFWVYIMNLFPEEHLKKYPLEFSDTSIRRPFIIVREDVEVPTFWDKFRRKKKEIKS